MANTESIMKNNTEPDCPGKLHVLVTGAGGQLGHDLMGILPEKYRVTGLARDELDVTDIDQCIRVAEAARPDVIIHAAAYTAVDRAEEEVDKAYAVNAFGARNMAVAARHVGAKLCYISTDYVFDGTSDRPYREYDTPRPLNVYGKSKLAGEKLVQTLSEKYFIVRTSWLYGEKGQNFVKTMLELAKKGNPLKVVHDQIGSPTYTADLARFLGELIATEKYGIYHASNSGSCSWYEFATAIFAEAGLQVQVAPCTTEEFPRPAPRPKFSVMDHASIRINGFGLFRPWQEALREFLKKSLNGVLPEDL